MNWIIVFVSVTVLILVLGGVGYWWFFMRKDDKTCCPSGYTRDYNYGVHVAANCDKKTQRCEKCIGTVKPPKDWPNKVVNFNGGKIHVTAPKC